MKNHFFIILLLSFQFASAQQVLWSSELLGYSSEQPDMNYSPKNRALQAVGKPNILPNGTLTPCAWSPSGSNYGSDWISVGFSKGLKIKQVAVSENVNPGAITKIYGISKEGTEVLLLNNTKEAPKEEGRLWVVILPETTFEVWGIKLVIEHAIRKGKKQIDAIAISDSETPIEIKLATVEWGEEQVQLENISYLINSPYGEVAPIISPDGKELFFTRLNHPDNIHEKSNLKNDTEIKQDIWYATKKGKTWSSPENIGSPLNNTDDNAATCISANGKTLYVLNVYKSDGTLDLGLSKSYKTGLGWSFPEKIIIEDFQALMVTDPETGREMRNTEFSITPDEKVILMGLKRSQSYGDRDLYVSFKKLDGTYSKPRSLGPTINTADNEGSPFIAADGKTLYFMSKGHLGFGNGDIFVSKRLDETWINWSEPLNLGQPINSAEWNGYINIPAESEYAFISTKINKNSSNDIYKVTLPPSLRPEPLAVVTGRIIDAITKKPIEGEIFLSEISDSANVIAITEKFLPENGEYKFILPVGRNYALKSTQKGYLGINDTLKLVNEKKYREIQYDFQMMQIRAGQKMILNNLFFERAKFDITEPSYEELNRIISLMNEYPTMEVMLEGYTDNQGDLMKNVELAQNRVNAVKRYLVQKGGIDQNRISVKSWGPTRPIASNATEETRKKNRRVEFTILKL